MEPVCMVLGAGAGIGGHVGKRFAQGGYHSVLCRRSDEAGLKELVGAIEAGGGKAAGFLLDGIVPGDFRVGGELGGGSWAEQPVLALREISLAAGETGEVVLTLSDPPAPPERVHIILESKPDWVAVPEGPGETHFDGYPDASIEDWLATCAVPPIWKVRMVNCVPGSPIDWAAITPTASPTLTGVPRARSRP